MKRANSRPVRAGSVTIGGGHPIVVQSMCATRTQDIEATVNQAEMIHNAGAGLVRIAVAFKRRICPSRISGTDGSAGWMALTHVTSAGLALGIRST